jgi:hypothetical protein
MLTAATRHGLKITVLSLVELLKYLFTLPDFTVFMSNRLCQDPLESFFGQQRQRGRVNENPNVLEFIRNTQALPCANIKGSGRGSQRSVPVTDGLKVNSKAKKISPHTAKY